MAKPTPQERAKAMLNRWKDRDKALILANENLALHTSNCARQFWRVVIKELEK
jgi:hypothetical protein